MSIEELITLNNIDILHAKNIRTHDFSEVFDMEKKIVKCSSCNISLVKVFCFIKVADIIDFTKLTCEEIQIKNLLE